MKLKSGQMVAERYEIDDVLGSGGMSVVYRAHDTKLDRFVTLKVLKEDYLNDEALLERFPKEARAAAALNHQNIQSVFDHGRDGDILYIVLEYVDGASLKELIVKKAPFDDETNLGVTIQVAEGLSEAHYNKIIHLDVKPQNILITTTSIVKVADFGIARAAKSVTLNAAAGSMGSVHYFSPEQARGGYIDHKSDIYSLGIVMYEMATGQLPFEGENEVAVALQHINDPLPDIAAINPNVSESVVRIIQKATEKSASKRYETIDSMIDDLKCALTDASGSFVEVEKTDVMSETRRISEENKEAVRRQKMRTAFLDGVDTPPEEEEAEPNFILRETPGANAPKYAPPEYVDGQEYSDDEYYDDIEPPPPPSPRKRPQRTVDKKADRVSVFGGIFLGLFFGIPIIIGAFFLYFRFLSPTAGMVATPNVVGMNLTLAGIETTRLGLVLDSSEAFCGVTSELRDEIISCSDADCEGGCEGYIIFQDAVAGTMLNPEDVLRVIVSAGLPGESELMPRVEGFTLDDARAMIYALDVDVTIETEYYDGDSAVLNTVFVQYPPPNAPLSEGDVITLTHTPDQEDIYVAVPNLTGRAEAEAITALRDHSLISVSEREYSDTFREGSIIRQNPSPGAIVERGVTRVTFWVSMGPGTPIPTPTPDPDEDENGDPEATPEPDENENGDPEATPEPNETPAPTTPPEMQIGELTVELPWWLPDDTETIHLQIWRQIGNADPTLVHNYPYTRVPVTLEIEYTEDTIFRLYSIENGESLRMATEPRPLP